MAGPTASIIFESPLSEAKRDEVLELIKVRADSCEGNDFWIEEQSVVETIVSKGLCKL